MNWLDVFGKLARFEDRQTPMYQQIFNCLQEAIVTGKLVDNSRLPTNRELAELLQVDRSTVSRAYFELQKKGLIESHVGRGTIVKSLTNKLNQDQDSFWSEKFSRASSAIYDIANRRIQQIPRSANTIALTSGIPTDEFYPYEEFKQIVARLFAQDRSEEMFGYSPLAGHPGLIAEVKKHLAKQSISCADDEVLIVSGSQQGIDLVANTLLNPDDAVLIEEPTYVLALSTFKAGQARFISVPLDQDGVNVQAIEATLTRQAVKLLYIMPNFQNPSGSTLSLAKRKHLLEVCAKYQVPILEDNYVGDLYYEESPLPSLKSLDRHGLVIHQGTFSKALCPGLRLGYLVATKEVMARLSMAKQARDLSTNSQGQVVMAEYLKQGLYDKHVMKLRKIYKARRDCMLAALAKYIKPKSMNGDLSWYQPAGGMFIWCKLPDGASARELFTFAEAAGVTFTPGDMFFLNSNRQEFFRLSFIQSNEETIEAGIERLSQALNAYLEKRKSEFAFSKVAWSNQPQLI